MAKIAVLAETENLRVADVICTSGPADRPFDEQHAQVSIAIVAGGTFQYRALKNRELMTPGSFLIGTPGQSYECSHDHGIGDRCLSFRYTPEFFEEITGARPRFRVQRLPPLRASALLVARAYAAMTGTVSFAWDELAVSVAAQTWQFANDVALPAHPVPSDVTARVTRIIRTIERHPAATVPLAHLAKSAGLSQYHFLRTFTRLTGATPHQFALRARLRLAALRLALHDERVIDIALDSGFGDVSNFNHSFRAEFGLSPLLYRRRERGGIPHQRERGPLRGRQSAANGGELSEP